MPALEVVLEQTGPIPLSARFEARAGELLALVGPSGSGKTTILRAIAGLYRPRSGRVAVDGEVWLDSDRATWVPPHRRRAGLVFQSYALFPHMSAAGNVAAALDHLAPPARLARARELLAAVHLPGLEDRRPADLSGGQQQRVAVARALAREPRVLLLDEPFSAVDRATRERLYRELAAMRRRLAMPIVLVTHDLGEALMLADTLSLLHRGQTLQHGPPAEVLRRPVSALAARLLGHRNIFGATVVESLSPEGFTIIEWGGRPLEAAPAEGVARGDRVTWTVPASKVVLHRRDRPSRGTRENAVSGILSEHLLLGDMTASTLRVDGAGNVNLSFQVPTHVAERNRLATGERVSVSLLAEAIHLMPPDD